MATTWSSTIFQMKKASLVRINQLKGMALMAGKRTRKK
jgi:hypothetical protein